MPNEPTSKPGSSCATIAIIRPLITSDSSPKVRTAYRTRNRTTIGRTRAFAAEMPSTAATRLHGSRNWTASSAQAATARAIPSTTHVRRT